MKGFLGTDNIVSLAADLYEALRHAVDEHGTLIVPEDQRLRTATILATELDQRGYVRPPF